MLYARFHNEDGAKKFQILNEFFENLNIFIKFIILSTIAKLAAFVSIWPFWADIYGIWKLKMSESLKNQ